MHIHDLSLILIFCSVMETIRNVIHLHAMYWDCFKYSILYNESSPEIRFDFVGEKHTKKDEIIYQTRNMYSKIDTTSFDMILNNIITGRYTYCLLPIYTN